LGSTGSVARDVIKQETVVNYTVKTNYLDRLSKQLGTSMGQALNQAMGLSTPAAKLR
jgi:protease IV